MQTQRIALAAFVGFGVAASAQAPKVNFTDHILPIFRNSCTNCHNPDKQKAGLDLTTYQTAMAGGESGAAVKPGNADGSLMYKVATHAVEPKMPPKGDKLGDADLKLIKEWIAGFALETANSKPAVAQANKVDAAIVSLTRPDGPVPMPGDLPLEPFVRARPLGAVTSLAASPWAPLVAVGGQKQVFLYHVESLELLGILAFPEGFPNVLRFSKNAKLLLAGGGLGGKSGKVVMWDVITGDRVGVVGNEADAILAADLSADQQFVALGGPDKRVKIYQTKDGKQTAVIKKHTDWITAIAYSPDGKYLATGDRNGGVEIWESAPEPKPFNTLAGHKSAVTALAFMPGVLASGGEDGKITLWNVKEGASAKSWDGHAGGVLWVDFTPDGRLVSCGRDKVAKVWDSTGKAVAKTEAFGDLAIRAAMNGERVIAADWSGEVGVFALADGTAKRIGALSANPPGIAEQLAAAEKMFAENNAAMPVLQKALADAEAKVKAEAEAAEAKRKAALADAEARKAAAGQRLAAAKSAPAETEKALGDLNGQLAAAKEAAGNAQQAINAAKAGVASAPPAASPAEVEAAKAAHAGTLKKIETVKADLQKAQQAHAKAKSDLPKVTAETDKAIAAANADIAKFSTPGQPAPAEGSNPGKLAELQQKYEALTAPLAPIRAERAKFEKGTPEYEKGTAALQAKKKEIIAAGADLDKISAEIEALRKARGTKPAAPARSEAQEALAKAKADLEAATARLAAARISASRLKRAQLYQNVFNVRQSLAEKQAKHDDLVATAKDAFREVELTKQAITAAQKTIADAPKEIAAKEAALAVAKKAFDEIKAALTAAEKAVEAGKDEAAAAKKTEAEIAENTKKLEALTATLEALRVKRAKFTAGTPEYAKADEAVQAKKKETNSDSESERLTAVIESAKARLGTKGAGIAPPEKIEAVKKAEADLKLAKSKLVPAEKALANAMSAAAEAKKQIPEMKARIPLLEAEGAKTKAQAEKAAALMVKEIQAAKAELEKVRAHYEASRGALQPPATTAAAATPVR